MCAECKGYITDDKFIEAMGKFYHCVHICPFNLMSRTTSSVFAARSRSRILNMCVKTFTMPENPT